MIHSRLLLCSLLVSGLLVGRAAAFDGQKVTEGPLTMTIEPVELVTQYELAQEARATIANADKAELAVELELCGLVDECRPLGATRQTVRVPGGAKTVATFRFQCGKGCLNAHYPLRVRAAFSLAGKRTVAEAVQVFETEFPAALGVGPVGSLPPLEVVPARGALLLATLKSQRVAWAYLDQPLVYEAPGWQGSDKQSAASFSRSKMVRSGQSRQSLQMHPAYRPKVGTVFAEYRLKLPAQGPIRFSFFNAIRDSGPREGASDGVTFRVWVDQQKLFDRHTDAKQWLPGEVDLSRFAGREILLRLESHPGPRRNTSCDSSFWGDPVVVAGIVPKLVSPEERQTRARQALAAAESGRASTGITLFPLQGNARAALALGPNGLADGALAFAADGRGAVFQGFSISLDEQPLGEWPSAVVTDELKTSRDASGRLRIAQRLRLNDRPLELTAQVWSEGPGLRVKFASTGRITDLAPGAVDRQAPTVYYGHGYVIRQPEAFRVAGGGHTLATSHVGFEFDGGLSLLVASDTPPDALEVDPERRLYSLHTHPEATFTFVPGAAGAMDCAVRYRPLYDKQPSAGVTKKAGRFVFDVWGGGYAENADLMERAFQYGLTDAMLLFHAWQRWGYDNRLPDIFPPDSRFGTLEDFQRLARVCAGRGVLFGLHDNYIDFYPDADGYSYEHITFDREGRPRKAWINPGHGVAQSYQWRPDRFMPFLDRNLALIKPALHPTASFVDVFTSANSFDYYDRQGNFHSRLETQRLWGECFKRIRDTLGDNAPTTSEAGSDHLIGYLDGADCQFLQLVNKARYHCSKLPCGDWDRVPWFDAVNHTRFSLHGVGYSNRYQGDLSRSLHGIESDDYLSAELLTGHALMIDRPGMLRGAVRKYWLAQPLIRSLAADEITRVEQPAGDIHRTLVTWKSGAKVWVNRGPGDWRVAGRVLPQYGYLARSGPLESAVERRGGAVVEQSRGPGWFYVNGRGFDPDPVLEIRAEANKVEFLGERRFRLLIDWHLLRPTDKDLSVKLFFYQPQLSRLVKTGFQLERMPRPGTSTWQGTATTGQQWPLTIPDSCGPGTYEVLVALGDKTAKSNQRRRMLGDEDPERRYRLGMLVVEGTKEKITGLRLEPGPVAPSLASRLLPNPKPTDFGPVTTTGALRCQTAKDRLTITPLVDEGPCPIDLDLALALGRPATVASLVALDPTGKKVREVPFSASGHRVRFTTATDVFAYEVRVK
jgi:hypothetical protein